MEINASVALKLAEIGQKHYPGTSAGPLFGYADPESHVIGISHVISFPTQHTSGDDVFNTKASNQRFQNEYLTKLKDSNINVTLVGWYLTATEGKENRQTLIESMLRYQEKRRKEEQDESPSIVVVYDPAKSADTLLSIHVLRLNESFVKTWNSESRFVARNLIDNRISYKNVFVEMDASIKNSSLTNLKIQELDPSSKYGEDLELTSNFLQTTNQNVDQLIEAVDNFNRNLGNFNYFQRNLSRELTKINQYRLRAKQENMDKLKANPDAKVTEPDWQSKFKLPQVPSKYENLVLGGSINRYCRNLEMNGSVEHAKTAGIQKSLDL